MTITLNMTDGRKITKRFNDDTDRMDAMRQMAAQNIHADVSLVLGVPGIDGLACQVYGEDGTHAGSVWAS